MEPRAIAILTSNGRGVTCLVQQFIGFWINLIKKASSLENLAQEVLPKSALMIKKS